MRKNRIGPDWKRRGRSCLAVGAGVMVFVVWLFLTVPLAWPIISALRDNTPAAKSPVLGGTNYLIVAPQGLSMSAGAWAEYRRSTGYLPRVLITAEADLTFPNLREQIQRIYAESGRPYPFFLLLLGHAHPDSSSPESYLPPGTLDSTAYAEFLNGATFIASDSMYAAQDDDVRLLPMAIGRVPAHGDKEAMRVLARVKEYESQPPAGEGRSRIDLIASDSGFGPQFDWLAETMLTYFVSDYLPEYYQWRILYGNPDSPYAVPAQEFPGAIADRLNSDSLLVMYVGHGMSDYLGPIRTPEGSYVQAFGMGDLPRVNHAGQSIAMLVGCLIGDYDSAGDQPSLAEQLLLQPGGVAASYAASRVSSAEGNTFLLKDLLTDILQDRVPTVGEWTRRAEAGFTNPSADRAILMSLGRNLVPELYKLTIAIPSGAAPEVSGELLYNLGQHTYNLFGDPALRVEYPMPDVKIRSEYPWLPVYESIKFSGRGRLQPGTRITVTLLTPPDRAWKGSTAPASNERSNDRTVAEISVAADETGAFSSRLDLPEGVPSGRYILEAVGVEGSNTHIGSQTIYLGWPPIGVIFLSLEYWWAVFSLLLLGMLWYFRRGRISRKRIGTPNVPEYSPTVASSGSAK